MNRRDFLKMSTAVFAGATFSGYIPEVFTRPANASQDFNRLENRKQPTELEKKHVPAIILPDNVRKDEFFPVTVKVGYSVDHPSVPEHWIDEIRLLVDGKEVSRLYYKVGGVTAPSATFMITLKKDSVLEAVEHCNLHGSWISDPVNVKLG